MAESAIQQAEISKDDMKTNVEGLFPMIETAMKQLHDAQEKAKQWKIPEEVWKLTDEMTRWDEQLSRAKAESDAGNYYLAQQLTTTLYKEITQKDNQLREMILAKEGKK